MAEERDTLRDWHRLFGLLLIDFFTGSPFTVEVERDLSEQQQLLDVVIVRRTRGKFVGELPDGLEGLTDHNLITFKSHHESLDDWAVRELLAHYVAYRKLVSPSTSELLAPEQFRLYAVAARFPHNLSVQVPWQAVRPGVYDCRWGLDVVRVIVASQLPAEQRNAPLHLFSASPELVGFGQGVYQRRSVATSLLLKQLFQRFRDEGFVMSFTMADFKRELFKEYFPQLSREEQQEVLEALPLERQLYLLETLPPERLREWVESLPPEQRLAGLSEEQRLAGLSEEQIRHYLDQLAAGRQSPSRKPRRRK